MTPPTLESIARPSGALAMVAMDPRESLRTMFDAAGAGRPPDRALIDFKRNVADVLGPLASGFLLDREYGFDEIRARLAPTAGLILAPRMRSRRITVHRSRRPGWTPSCLSRTSTFAEWMYAHHTMITASQVGHDVLIRAALSSTA
jgi:tagatose-1,6-bisphosphate aldolase